jgi:outer membrane protease
MSISKPKHLINRLNIRLAASALLFFINTVIYAEIDIIDIKATVDIDSGLFWGTAHEYVLKDSEYLSHLEWQENWTPFVSLSGKINLANFFVKAGIVFAIPGESGYAQDYDYFLIPQITDVTNYSKHTAYLDKHTDILALLGHMFYLGRWTLSPVIGIVHRDRKWSAVDGYLQYADIGTILTENEPKVDYKGTILSYEQKMFFPVAGFRIDYKINEMFSVALDGGVYPYIWAQTIDNHFDIKKQYHDAMEGGFGGKAAVSASHSPAFNKNTVFKLNVCWEGYGLPEGDTSSGNTGSFNNSLTPDKSANSKTEGSIWSVSLGVLFNF